MRYVTWSFNPCSYGSSVLTKNDFFNQREIKKFQSLFLWIFRSYNNLLITFKSSTPSFNPCSYGSSVLTCKKYHVFGIKYRRFQSLFLWIFRSYSDMIQELREIKLQFQSLFLWIFRSYDRQDTDKSHSFGSFNPCSYGSSVLTSCQKFKYRFRPRAFQSLFLWIFRSY